jgi:response regulator of citrate/malate metabolism
MTLNLLLIDDDAMVIFIHQSILESVQLTKKPLVFRHGKEVLDFLIENNVADTHHLLMLDINMPVMDGWELLDAIQLLDKKANISVIMVTSSIDQADQLKAYRYPQVIDYLIKPIDFESIQKLKEIPLFSGFFIQ